MSKTLIGHTGVTWGTIGNSNIIIENISKSDDGDWDELQDGNGDIVAAVAYGDKTEVSFDFTIKGDTSSYLKERGKTISVPDSDVGGGLTLYVQSTSKEKEKNGWMTGSATAIAYPNLGS